MTNRYRPISKEGGDLTYLLERYRLTPSELFVLNKMGRREHPRKVCFPRQSTIARETGLHKTTVKRTIHALKREGLLDVHKPRYYPDHWEQAKAKQERR